MTVACGETPTLSVNPFVAAEVRALLARRGVKQKELAQQLGVNDGWLSRRLRGATPLDLDDLFRIAQACDVEVRDLVLAAHKAWQEAVSGYVGRRTSS